MKVINLSFRIYIKKELQLKKINYIFFLFFYNHCHINKFWKDYEKDLYFLIIKKH